MTTLDDVDDDLAVTHDEDEAEDAVEPFYPGVEEWVTQFFVPAFTRATGSRWCARWWAHTEAVITLRALWMSWEGARLENGPGSIASWLVNIAYPLHHEVCGPSGPFAACTEDRHAEAHTWTTTPVPAGYWPDDDF